MADAVAAAAPDSQARPRMFSPELYSEEAPPPQEAALPRWEKRQIAGAAIAPRSSHSASLTAGDRLWIYGGYGGENRKHDVLADFFCVETSNDRFEATPVVPLDRPEKRVGHCMLALQNNLYVTGGWTGKKYLNYGFLLDIESEHLLLEKHKGRVTPEARRDHSVVGFGRKLVLFGGWNIHEQFADVWVLDKHKWKWKQAEVTGPAPSPRRGHSAVRIGKKMWVFGGIQGFSKYLDDTYVLDLETFEWSVPALAGQAPSCRAWHSAVQLGNTAQILVFGGTAGRVNFYNDVFILDTAKCSWFRLPTQGAPVHDKVVSSPEEDLAAVGVSTGRPSGRCSHSATMIGSKMVVFGGLAPSAVDQKVYPLNEVWVLETGLQLERADEEEEPEDKEDEDEEADPAGLGATLGGSAFHSSAPLMQPSAQAHGSDSEQPVEGWLSIFTPAVKEKRDDTWNRRYFRINGTDLLVYTQKEKGNLQVAEGVVKVWGERKNRFVRGSQIDALPKDVSTITLEDILSDPESPLAKHFLEFCKSIYSEENAQFYLDAESFKRLPEGAEQAAAASDIFEKFVKPGAPMQIDLPVVQQEQIKNDVNNKTIASGMFDNAQKRVLHVMRVDHLPKYSEHVMSLRARADQKFVLKTALTEQDRAVQACEHCLSKFSVFRARNWCRLCGDVFCGSCINNTVRLPAKYGVAEPVRVCDQCAGDLNGLKFAFSLVSKRRSRPLNLAASSDKELRKWVSAFNRALQVPSHDREKAQAFASGASSAPTPGSPQPPSPAAGSAASPDSAVPDGSKPSDAASSDPVHLEGWLMKEDPSTKTYRKRYFILHHTQLFYYQLTLQHEFMSLPGGEINVVSAAEPTLLETRPRSGSEDDGSSAFPCLKGGFKIGSGFAYRFNITTATNTSPSSQTSFKLAADSEQERLQWVDTIHKVMQAKPSDVKPAAARPKPPPIVTTASALSLTDAKDSSMVSPASPSSPLTPVSPRAPEGPSGEVVFVCADVEGSTALWEGAPEATNEALHSNQELLKRLSVQHRGYPVKSQLDSFIFTFASAKDAAYWAAAVQTSLLQLEWPHELLAVPEAKRETDAAGSLLFNGVRIRMAIFQGQPRCRANPITGRVEYSGPVLHTASALAESAHGGQVVMSEEVYQALQQAIAAEESERKDRAEAEAADDDSDDSGVDEPSPPPPPPQSTSPQLVFADLGPHSLPLPAAADESESKDEEAPPPPPGSTSLRVFQMLPKALEARTFPPLRHVSPVKPAPSPAPDTALVADYATPHTEEEVPGPPPS